MPRKKIDQSDNRSHLRKFDPDSITTRYSGTGRKTIVGELDQVAVEDTPRTRALVSTWTSCRLVMVMALLSLSLLVATAVLQPLWLSNQSTRTCWQSFEYVLRICGHHNIKTELNVGPARKQGRNTIIFTLLSHHTNRHHTNRDQPNLSVLPVDYISTHDESWNRWWSFGKLLRKRFSKIGNSRLR
jgi:hypothetical protein